MPVPPHLLGSRTTADFLAAKGKLFALTPDGVVSVDQDSQNKGMLSNQGVSALPDSVSEEVGPAAAHAHRRSCTETLQGLARNTPPPPPATMDVRRSWCFLSFFCH